MYIMNWLLNNNTMAHRKKINNSGIRLDKLEFSSSFRDCVQLLRNNVDIFAVG